MVINTILLLFVFGAAKKKLSPYLAALIFGAIKGAIYFFVLNNVVVALAAFAIFYGLVAGLIYFFRKLDKREMTKDPSTMYSANPKESFKWEYLPITLLVILIVGGEFIVA